MTWLAYTKEVTSSRVWTARLGSSMPASGLKLMPVHMSTAAPKSITFSFPSTVTSTLSCVAFDSGSKVGQGAGLRVQKRHNGRNPGR